MGSALPRIDLVHPWLLVALAPLAVLGWYLIRRPRARGRRGSAAVALRLTILALLLLALARPRALDEVDDLAIVFLLDVSTSVPLAERDRALTRIERHFENIEGDDRASLIVFSERASVEVPFRGASAGSSDAGLGARLDHLESRIDLGATNVAGALELAAGSFPKDMAQRIVLVSDGNETQGDLREAARALSAERVQLHVWPVTYRHDEEVMVEGLHGSGRGRLDEPLHLRAVISAQAPTDAELTFFENGLPLGEPERVRLDAGMNVFRFSPLPPASGYHQYEVRVSAARDGNRSNNVGRAGVLVAGAPRVFMVASEDDDQRIGEALFEAGIAMTELQPTELPKHPAGYFLADTVVLSNVAAYDLESSQLEALRSAVVDLGVGLVVVGGDKAFAPGGYRGTPLESLLPVDLDTSNKKSLPKGALVIVLHSVEFDSGNTWAITICKAALDGLSEDDEAGIVYYDHSLGETWLFDLAPLGERKRQYELIDKVFPGDMPSFHNCFVKAESSLGRSDAAVKHVVVISDGDPQEPDAALVDRLLAAKVTISTVCVAPHGPTSVPTLFDLAARGGGRFFLLDPNQGDLKKLPAIMVKEATTLRRPSIREEPFVPSVLLPTSPLLRGLGSEWPELGGYLVTSMKAGAETVLLADEEESDPLLAAWYAGLGRVVAFTSDASSRWGKNWLGWSKFGPFWTQLVRSTVLEVQGSEHAVTARVNGTSLEVVFDANREDGSALVDLAPRGALLAEGDEHRSFGMEQREPGRYVASLESISQGHYLVSLDFEQDGQRRRAVTVAAVDYAPEHRSLTSREDALAAAAEATGGRVLGPVEDPLAHDFAGVRGQAEYWRHAIVLAAVLLVLEVALRRLDFDPFAKIAALFSRARVSMRSTRSKEAAVPVAARPSAPSPELAVPMGEERAEEAPRPDPPRPKEPEQGDVLSELKKAKQRAEKRREWK